LPGDDLFRIKIGSVTFFINFIMAPLLILLFILGCLWEYIRIYAFIAIHELAHGIAAVYCGRRVESVFITPGGLCIQLDVDIVNGYYRSNGNYSNKLNSIRTYKKLLILTSGPLANLLLAALFQLAGKAGAAQANLALALFNLLPVKPLDGYWICLSMWRGEKAIKVASVASKVIMAVMTVLAILGLIAGMGSIITVITLAVLLVQMLQGRTEAKVMRARNIFTKRKRLRDKGLYKGKILVVTSSSTPENILSQLGNDAYHFVFVLDNDLKLSEILTEQQVLDAIVNDKSDIGLGNLIDHG